MEKQETKILVLLSGGIDSTTCLAMAVDKVGKDNVETLTMSYGQKNIYEVECAKRIADYYNVNYVHMDISQIFKYSNCPLLAQSTQEIQHISYEQQVENIGGYGAVSTYVPFRNGLMLSACACYAISKGCTEIHYGAHQDDASGGAYPDCTPEFVNAMNEAIYEGSGKTVKMIAPLINMKKSEVIKKGIELKAPYHMTQSCYEGGHEPCGVCGTCRKIIESFKKNNVKAPFNYPVDIDWGTCKDYII